MKAFRISSIILFTYLFLFTGCDSQSNTPKSSEPGAQTVPSPGPPRHGGYLKRVVGAFPKILGYPEEFAPIDSDFAAPALERLVSWDEAGNLIPILAESWEGDPEKKTITWYLRKGVLFTDGTDWNAEALKWNWESRLSAGRMVDGKYVKSLEVMDDHTLRMHLSDYHRSMFHNYGWSVMVSPTAFEKAGGGDLEKSKEWARSNAVGTGPFRIVEFKRDVLIRYERNDNYWRKNRPYFDGFESRLIPDPMIASAMMQAGEADMFTNVDVRTALDLEEMGVKVNWGPGMLAALLPNSSDPDSPFADRRVREAVEYAIDRPALAKMIGHGKYEPLTQLAGKKFPGYIPDYNPRPYNVAKARQLLAEAGYPGGFRTKIMANDILRDPAAALQSYLGEVGIKVDLDIADTARYMAAVFADGWTGLVLAISGVNPDATDLFVHFGKDPMTYRTGNIAKSEEYLALCSEALHTYDKAGHYSVLKRMVRQASEDAMVVPLYITALATAIQPYVHSDYPRIHIIVWDSWDDWMEEH
ncbi:ABC transporter substrate-binding protein [Thermodesulfobacteriota bacterium]